MSAEVGTLSVVTARLDGCDRIRAADDLILRLQAAAGGEADGRIAIPQIAAVARLARRLDILIARPLLIGGQDYDIRLWIRAKPVGDGVDLEFSEWQESPHADGDATAAQRAAQISLAPDGVEWRTDGQMRFLYLGADVEIAAPGDEFFDAFSSGGNGPDRLAGEISARRAFFGLTVRLARDSRRVRLSGHPLFDVDGAFLGYRGKISFCQEGETVAGGVAPPTTTGEGEDMPLEGGDVVLPDFGRRLDLALRQPLGRIIANAETIKGQMEGPLRTDYTAYAADIADAGRHLMELVDDLADLQAIDRPGFHVANEDIDLADLARRAAGLLGMKAADKRIRVEMPVAEVKVPAMGEFRRALQIIVNLLTNAIRYSPEGSDVRIETEQAGDWAVLTVADQGRGIAPEDREKVFDKFERLGRSDVAGSGLGLYISRRLARAMKGDIIIQDAPDQGARFLLRLPVA